MLIFKSFDYKHEHTSSACCGQRLKRFRNSIHDRCLFVICRLQLCFAMATSFVAERRIRYPAAPLGAVSRGDARVQGDQRYSKNIYHKTVKERNQGLVWASVKGLQKTQNHVKTKRKFKPKRRVPRTVPRAPFNDSSFLMRVRRSGGLAALVESPALSSSSVFSSPAFSNLDSVSYQDFLDHEDYGYGSMAGLIRLRGGQEEREQSIDGSATVANNFNDVNMSAGATAQNLQQRLDRFEMADLPARDLEDSQRAASHDSRIRYLEDENLVLESRLILIQQEVNELRERLPGGRSSDMVREKDESTQSCLDTGAKELAGCTERFFREEQACAAFLVFNINMIVCTTSRLPLMSRLVSFTLDTLFVTCKAHVLCIVWREFFVVEIEVNRCRHENVGGPKHSDC